MSKLTLVKPMPRLIEERDVWERLGLADTFPPEWPDIEARLTRFVIPGTDLRRYDQAEVAALIEGGALYKPVKPDDPGRKPLEVPAPPDPRRAAARG